MVTIIYLEFIYTPHISVLNKRDIPVRRTRKFTVGGEVYAISRRAELNYLFATCMCVCLCILPPTVPPTRSIYTVT